MILPEELLLLALDPGSGKVASNVRARLTFGLAGAVLAELALRGRIEVTSEDGPVRVLDTSPIGDSILDAVLTTIASATSTRTVVEWIRRTGGGRLQNDLADRLVQQGILRHEERKLLWIVTSHRYPANDTSLHQTLEHRLRLAVLPDGANTEPDARVIALLSLAQASNLTPSLFPEWEREIVHGRLAEMRSRDTVGAAVVRAMGTSGSGNDESTLIIILAVTDASASSASTEDGSDGSDGGDGGGGGDS